MSRNKDRAPIEIIVSGRLLGYIGDDINAMIFGQDNFLLYLLLQFLFHLLDKKFWNYFLKVDFDHHNLDCEIKSICRKVFHKANIPLLFLKVSWLENH